MNLKKHMETEPTEEELEEEEEENEEKGKKEEEKKEAFVVLFARHERCGREKIGRSRDADFIRKP